MYIIFIHDQVSRGKYGLSIDADVGLWLEKRQLDGELDLDTVGNVIIDSSLHSDFDDFKDTFQQYTRRGFSMIPQNELFHYYPRRACAARVLLVGSVCLCVCVCVSYSQSHLSNVRSSHKRYDLLSGQRRSEISSGFI